MNPVRVDARRVTARELRRNRIRMRVMHADSDIERLIIVQHPHFSRIDLRSTRCRIALCKARRWLSSAPRCVVELSVDRYGTGAPNGLRNPAPCGWISAGRGLRNRYCASEYERKYEGRAHRSPVRRQPETNV